MKYKFKISSKRASSPFVVLKKPLVLLSGILKNVLTSYSLMSQKERYLMFLLFLVGFFLLGFKFYQVYLVRTIAVADTGGEYQEAIVGEVKYLNPILAQSDVEKGISKLLFSGLVRVDPDGKIVPDLAEKYEISADGKKYTFHLRNNLKFSDGTVLTAQDVAYTIDSIKVPETKSPINKSWSDVTVSVVDPSTIVMELLTAYGPFIYNCNFGVMPATLSSSDFSKKIVGSGPFSYVKLSKSNEKINDIKLKKNNSYYGDKPFIDNLELKIFDQKTDAENAYQSDSNITALFGGISDQGVNLDFKSSKRLGLVLNLRSDKLKDKAVRQKILSGTKIDEGIKFGLTTLDAPLQREKAEEIKRQFQSQNISVEIFYFSAVKLQDALDAKNYDLLLYGFDFSYDRDPYTFWHSSQLTAQNFAGWSDKDTDILLEDARMLTDEAERNVKYDQFFNSLSAQFMIKFYDPITYNFRIKSALKGILSISGNQSYSRYENIIKWYIKEKRVSK